MSSLTRCNYCTLQTFRTMARSSNRVVTIRPAPLPPEWPEGVDIYLHPPDYTPPPGYIISDPDQTRDGEWWVAWFASLPFKCACDS